MFVVNEDNSIYATRGDTVFFGVTMEEDGVPQMFHAGDVVRIKIYGKKAAENVALEKDFPVTDDAERVEIYLTEEDTKIGEVISKPTDYWYEIELNPESYPQTIIGYDEDGAKIFKLFPEGADLEKEVITKEDIPVVDEELSLTSDRPVRNGAITRTLMQMMTAMEDIWEVIYPVGAVYISVNEADPSVLFGGTWERLKDRFLLGAGDTYAAGETGGEAKHRLEEWEMPAHTHNGIYDETVGGQNMGIEWGDYAGTERGYGITFNGTMQIREAGGELGKAEPHNNMPPYLAVYMWQRIS